MIEEKYKTYGGIHSNNGKLYMVEFTNRVNGDQFIKFGITKEYDVLNRFKGEEYHNWDIRVLASAYGTKTQVEQAEEWIQKKYPKNFWLKENISGVTEIVKLDKNARKKAIQEVRLFSSKWKELRGCNENKP